MKMLNVDTRLGAAVQGSGPRPRGLWRSTNAQQHGHNADKRQGALEEVISFFFPAEGRVQLGGLGGRGSDSAVEICAVPGASRVPVG
jgi:hypothetical protein